MFLVPKDPPSSLGTQHRTLEQVLAKRSQKLSLSGPSAFHQVLRPLYSPAPDAILETRLESLILPSLLKGVGGAKLRSKMPSGWFYQGSN